MHVIFFIFYILFLIFATPSYAQEWDSPFQEFDFGKARILSCFTGIKDKTKLYMGLHILPNPDWNVQEPQLTWTASDDSLGKAFIPFSQPFKNEYTYPAIFWLKQNQYSSTYSAEGTIRACHIQQGCNDFPVQFNILLEPQIAFQTPQCITILSALAQTPKPWPNAIHGQAIEDANGTAHITLQLPQDSKKIRFFKPDKTPLILQNLQHKGFLLSFDLPVANHEDIYFLLQTQYDIYEVKLPILDKTTPKIKVKLPLLEWLKLLLISFIFSPLFMVWGHNNQISTQTCKRFNYYICISIALASIIGIICAWFPELWIVCPLNKTLSIILITATLLWGKSSPFLIFLGLVFMPKPLWDNLQLVSSVNRIMFVLILSAIWFALFGGQIRYAQKIHHFFKKWHKLTPLGLQASFSLFLFLLLCYTIFYL